MPPPGPMQIRIATVDRAAFPARRANDQMPRGCYLFDDPKFIDNIVVRFALGGCRHLVGSQTRRSPVLAESINDPIARSPISLEKHFSPASNTDRIDPQAVHVELVVVARRI